MLDAANDTLVAAFIDDSLFGWGFPDPAARAPGLRRLNRVPLEYGQRYGDVRQSDEGRCVAIWIPPGEPMSPGRMVRCGMLAVPPCGPGWRPCTREFGSSSSRSNAAMEASDVGLRAAITLAAISRTRQRSSEHAATTASSASGSQT